MSIVQIKRGSSLALEHGGQIYTSTDSGANWTARETNRTWRAVASNSDGTKLVAVVIGGQIYTKPTPLTLTVSPIYSKISFTNTSASNLTNFGLQSVSSWGNLTNIENMFRNNFGGTSYGCVNLLSVPTNFAPTHANGAFDGCSSLDLDFTGFSLQNLTSSNLNTFMRGVALSRANYNKTLVYWNTNKASYPFNNIIINMGNSKSDTTSGGANGSIAKLNLVSYGWTITDIDGTVGP